MYQIPALAELATLSTELSVKFAPQPARPVPPLSELALPVLILSIEISLKIVSVSQDTMIVELPIALLAHQLA